jgi:hypothetical protein
MAIGHEATNTRVASNVSHNDGPMDTLSFLSEEYPDGSFQGLVTESSGTGLHVYLGDPESRILHGGPD